MAKRIVVQGSSEHLVAIYHKFVLHLLQAVESERRPPAAVLSIIRKFLQDQGVNVASGAITTSDQMRKLASVVLPFNVKPGSVAVKAKDEK